MACVSACPRDSPVILAGLSRSFLGATARVSVAASGEVTAEEGGTGSSSLPAPVHGRQSHVLVSDSQETCPFSWARLEKRMSQTLHLVVERGIERSVLPDIRPHGHGFMEVPREGETRGHLLVCVPETACRTSFPWCLLP